MRKVFIVVTFIVIAFLIIRSNFLNLLNKSADIKTEQERYMEISGIVKKGETLFDIFKKYKLDIGELFKLREVSADIHRLRDLYPGRHYAILIDDASHINRFTYWIDDDNILNISRTEAGFYAKKVAIEYEKRICHIGGQIKDNLISSVGEGMENLMLALQLSDIFAWDIDFTTDLRNGDIFKIVVETLYLNGEFKKYGDILSTEFINNGEKYYAYRFEHGGEVDYYDADGKSLRRSFLKSPLNFRRISSGFSYKRFHPILKIYRPHLGVDYAASAGTPVSAVGDGTVVFAGYKGQNGNIVIIRHFNGYRTFYGHLSKIVKGLRKGVKIKQGQVIGYVGATGLATGPHLDYRIKVNNRFVNPLTLKLPRGKPVPKTLIAEFENFKNKMDIQLASIMPTVFEFAEMNNRLERADGRVN
ncbi:MAG: peptidoglycan DD-metalloendopeptidase family protein [Nitrospirota bacterium]